jgi:drug/metabolite transporter (DMT)-like permease
MEPRTDHPHPPSRLSLTLAFASIYLIWGSTYLGIRVAVETMPPFLMASARFALAGSFLFVWLRYRGAERPTRRQWRDAAIVGTLLLLGGNGSVAWAEQFVPSGITALIIGASPLFMVLTEWAWPGGSRPSAGIWFALLIGFGGVAWLAAPWESGADALPLAGVAAILGGSICWSIGSIYSRHAPSSGSPFMAAALQMLAGSAALALAAVLHGDWWSLELAAISDRSWTAFAYLTVAGSLIGFSTFVWLLKHTTPARVATYAYVNPVVAVFLGWLLLAEPVGPRTFVASATIVAAVAIITTRQTAAKSAPAPRGAAGENNQ